MSGKFLLKSDTLDVDPNIYANKSALILTWLLQNGSTMKAFSLSEIANGTGVSVGLAHKVLKHLHYLGIITTQGIRTGKKFSLEKPQLLLKNWIKNYSILKKCKMWTYSSGISDVNEMINKLAQNNVAFALHTAAEMHGCKNTNLQTMELYLLDLSEKSQIENLLELAPQERGYDVLLIKPYYKCLLKPGSPSSPLHTFLDLYHFPLRGQEQAEFMAERIPEIQQIFH